jgi:16S rRNA (adenine1518-N6/adenine1519-N6)-dimethyltransferase
LSHHPKPPKLGQHFLADLRLGERIVSALDLRADDLVVEIGPGRGAMTSLLLQHAKQVVGIELDSQLVAELERRFAGRAQILHADILNVDLAALCERYGVSTCFVFGNLPYYITSPILHHLFRFHRCIRAMGLLMQWEVAERVVAQPGSRPYGYLSVLAQWYSQPTLVLRVPPGAFTPPPKVQSALVTFHILSGLRAGSASRRGALAETGMTPEQESTFLEFVQLCFAQKRKTLLNNLGPLYSRTRVQNALGSLGLKPSARAEQLGIDELLQLFLTLSRQNSGE